ncbi:MAG: LysE family transporter [Spirochaetes bacterium]|nr:LysE family transporter [Spirochaetota bacterium]
MNSHFFLRGLIIGISIAAPVGPIGILCIRRSLTQGQLSGFVSGLGAATADAVYGCVAAFGLTFISDVLIEQKFWIRLVGGAFLLYLGIRTILAEPVREQGATVRSSPIGAYASTFILTLTNPMTILSFAAVFAALGVGSMGGDYLSAGLVVGGVFLGSATWWLTLSTIVSLFRKRFSVKSLRWVNRAAGAILCGFGVFALVSVPFLRTPLLVSWSV